LYLTAGLAALLALLLFLTREREPYYQGKPLSYWVDVYALEWRANPDNPPTNGPGAIAIRHIGPAAFPWLLRWISYDHPSFFDAKTKDHVTHPPSSGEGPLLRECGERTLDESRADSSARAFAVLDGYARAVILDLEEIAYDPSRPNAACNAINALGVLGDDAVPALLEGAFATNALLRNAFVSVLGEVAIRTKEPASIISVLVLSLDDTNGSVQMAAAVSLCRLARHSQPQPEVVVPALTKYLNANPRTDSPHIGIAALALGAYGQKAKPAIPVLLQICQSPNSSCRALATNAIMNIAPEVLTNAPLSLGR
jgi:HEAT repeat protein